LFVDSGTIITDWEKFFTALSNYPHQGFVAHLIWHPAQNLCIDQQCWFMNLDKFEEADFVATTVNHPHPVRSEKNIHDDYTPLWVVPSAKVVDYAVDGFGQGLIAKQLSNNCSIVNWNNEIRSVKHFMYPHQEPSSWKTHFQQYLELAETQFWVFNNEPIQILNQETVVTPASGVSWMFNLVSPNTDCVQLVDISSTQLKFANQTWQHWNGNNYGEWCVNFIRENNLTHYELDQPNLSPLERLKLKNFKTLLEYVDSKFAELLLLHKLDNFQELWANAKRNKTVEFHNNNLINWVINNGSINIDTVWASNILDYKWTMLNTDYDQCNKFLKLLK
jgi:hypothetical protein